MLSTAHRIANPAEPGGYNSKTIKNGFNYQIIDINLIFVHFKKALWQLQF